MFLSPTGASTWCHSGAEPPPGGRLPGTAAGAPPRPARHPPVRLRRRQTRRPAPARRPGPPAAARGARRRPAGPQGPPAAAEVPRRAPPAEVRNYRLRGPPSSCGSGGAGSSSVLGQAGGAGQEGRRGGRRPGGAGGLERTRGQGGAQREGEI